MNKIIEILVSPAGETQIQTKGFTGSTCRDASRVLEAALGACASETLTAEFHQQAGEQTAEQRQRS